MKQQGSRLNYRTLKLAQKICFLELDGDLIFLRLIQLCRNISLKKKAKDVYIHINM